MKKSYSAIKNPGLKGKSGRRRYLRKLGGLTASIALLSPAANASAAPEAELNDKSNEMEGTFLHVVFFWLKDEKEETVKKFLFELREYTDNIDLIKTRHIGAPAETNRDVIDSSWDFSLILSFESKKEQDLYQAHPLHKTFIANASSLWVKVQVYDSVKL